MKEHVYICTSHDSYAPFNQNKYLNNASGYLLSWEFFVDIVLGIVW